ncbi:hypothetical protein [Erysipelothrix piscisicarius]
MDDHRERVFMTDDNRSAADVTRSGIYIGDGKAAGNKGCIDYRSTCPG